MKKTKILIAFALVGILLSGCGSSSEKKIEKKTSQQLPSGHPDVGGQANIKELPQFTKEVLEGERLVQLDTTVGTMKIKLFEKKAPKAVENFLKLSKKGYYNNLDFHTVVNDLAVQAGDPKADGSSSIWGKAFEDELNEDLRHFKGALSMANSGKNSNGSQFFIVSANGLKEGVEAEMNKIKWQKIIIDAYKEAGGVPNLDGRYTVFGQVIEGIDTLDKINSTKVDEKTSVPLTPIKIKSIKVIK